MVINLVTEFSFYRFVVYRNHLFTNKAGQRELAQMAAETSEPAEETAE